MAKINHYQLLSYIDMLKRFGMIEEVSAPFNGFVITEKGRTFLKIINSS
jgi:predicted transcriptional regulator